jgi:6-pyruvoyltetrahydropterin/6-carboxytetrahydropterin synthase
MGLRKKENRKDNRKTVIVAPPVEMPAVTGKNGGLEGLPEDFWDIDEPVVLGLFLGHYYEISIDTFFNASHTVVIKGRKGPLHTHSYRLGVRCRSKSFSGKEQVIADYSTLRDRINRVAQAYNHQFLNDLPPFRHLKSTTENLTAVLFQQLTKALKGLPVELVSITIWESPTVAVTLTKDELGV